MLGVSNASPQDVPWPLKFTMCPVVQDHGLASGRSGHAGRGLPSGIVLSQ